MNFPKSNLTRAFIQRVALIFILLFLFITLFYRWGFPTYYYWKMEQPVKEAQKLIQTGHEDQIPDDLVVVAVDNQTSVSEEELTSDITFRLNQEGIALNRFWIDQTTTEAVKKSD